MEVKWTINPTLKALLSGRESSWDRERMLPFAWLLLRTHTKKEMGLKSLAEALPKNRLTNTYGDGKVIHGWDQVREDDYRAVEQLPGPPGWTNPRYIGWVSVERILQGHRQNVK